MEVEKTCSNCKYDNLNHDEKPCCDCRNTLIVSNPDFPHRPFLWEKPCERLTLEEKSKRIKEYCLNRPGTCSASSLGRCPLSTTSRTCYTYYNEKTEKEVAENYEILFGKEDTAEPEAATEKETVNHPAHYQGKHECIDEMIALFGVEAVKHFCMCNVYKYRYRAANKNGQEDLDKADWYMDKLMELEERHD